MLLVGHILFNIINIFYFFADIRNVREINKIVTGYTRVMIIGSFVLGCTSYILYWIISIMTVKKDGFDYPLFTILLVSWAFMLSADRIFFIDLIDENRLITSHKPL